MRLLLIGCSSLTRRSMWNKEGVAAIEYGLLAALIAVVIITAVSLVGTHPQVFQFDSGCCS